MRRHTVWDKRTDMWGVALICVAVASCNAELYELKTAALPTTAEPRIVGGSSTTIQKYPFAVQIISKCFYQCGGSLLTSRHVLSAAHCFFNKNGHLAHPSSCFIRVGTTILDTGGSFHLVTAFKTHELYDTKTHNNDVAVVLMAPRVDWANSVARPAVIPYQNAVVPDDSFVTVIGWGLTEANVSSLFLMEVTVQKIKRKTCNDRFKWPRVHITKPTVVTSNMICAGILDVGGKDTCQGDSGGPLLYEGTVVGVTSWGINCATPKFPGVYANVAKFTNWINYTINESLQPNKTGTHINTGNTGSLSSKVGAITLLTSLLYLIISV